MTAPATASREAARTPSLKNDRFFVRYSQCLLRSRSVSVAPPTFECQRLRPASHESATGSSPTRFAGLAQFRSRAFRSCFFQRKPIFGSTKSFGSPARPQGSGAGLADSLGSLVQTSCEVGIDRCCRRSASGRLAVAGERQARCAIFETVGDTPFHGHVRLNCTPHEALRVST